MLGIYEYLLKQVDNRARFLSGVLSGDIQCGNRKKNELREEFSENGFDPLPKGGESPDVDASDYDYLTEMPVSSFTEEYLEHLLVLKKRFEIKVGILRRAAAQYLKAEKEPTMLDKNYKKAQLGRDLLVHMAAKDRKAFEAAPRIRCKRTAAESLEASAMLMDDDEEEAPEPKYQSEEHTETESAEKQERKRQRRHRKKRRMESSETGATIRCCRITGHDRSGDGFLMEEIKRIASGLDGIEITHCDGN